MLKNKRKNKEIVKTIILMIKVLYYFKWAIVKGLVNNLLSNRKILTVLIKLIKIVNIIKFIFKCLN